MPTPKTPITLHDSPIRLVLQLIVISLLFGVLYLAISVTSEFYPAFDDTQVLGSFLTLDFVVFISLLLLQQCVTLYLLLKWVKLTYAFDDVEFNVQKGIIFRRITTVPLDKITSVKQDQSPLGRLFDYSTIRISIINQPDPVVVPYMTQPRQTLSLLGFAEDGCQ
jgi:uncharacterized membrane protein YdbT with pleckstrin-like domain